MKKTGLTFALFCLIFGITDCSKSNTDGFDVSNYTGVKLDTITFSHSLKGYELYSWPISSSWKYSLMVGTNATKTLDQVLSNRISVVGEDSLKVLLSKLPVNENITWLGRSWLQSSWQSVSLGTLSLPDKSIQIDIKEFCDNHNLKLTIIE